MSADTLSNNLLLCGAYSTPVTPIVALNSVSQALLLTSSHPSSELIWEGSIYPSVTQLTWITYQIIFSALILAFRTVHTHSRKKRILLLESYLSIPQFLGNRKKYLLSYPRDCSQINTLIRITHFLHIHISSWKYCSEFLDINLFQFLENTFMNNCMHFLP